MFEPTMYTEKPWRVLERRRCHTSAATMKNHHRHGHAEEVAMTDSFKETRKAGDVSASGQKFAEAAQEDPHREGRQDRVRSEISDHQSHHSAGCSADRERRGGAHEEGERAGVDAAVLVENPREREAAQVRGIDDREIDAAGDDPHQHRKRQQA
jgi:hypothetical protein